MQSGRDAPYQHVLETLIAEIRSAKPGARLESETALSARFGVGRSTVSRVMWLLRYVGLVAGPAGGTTSVSLEPVRGAALRLLARAAILRARNGQM